jgi:choline kinase
MKNTSVVILAAGKGSRLGFGIPKALVEIANKCTILEYQLNQLARVFNEDVNVSVVIGYKKELFSSFGGKINLLFNPLFDSTNTGESLALALSSIEEEFGVLWINGDVYFDDRVMKIVVDKILSSRSFIGIQFGDTDDEAMKFRRDEHGNLLNISKNISSGEGEAVGINYINSHDRKLLLEELRLVKSQDYYEMALDRLANLGAVTFEILDLTRCFVREIDFLTDLEKVRDHIKISNTSIS